MKDKYWALTLQEKVNSSVVVLWGEWMLVLWLLLVVVVVAVATIKVFFLTDLVLM